MSAAATLTKPVAGVPMGVWAVVGAGGVFFAYRSYKSQTAKPTTTQTVEQVPVPVGAVGAVDQAPMVVSPIVRINVPQIGALTDAITNNTASQDANSLALGGNTDALGGNTGALGANTGALGSATGATVANTGALSGLTGAVGGLTAATGALTSKIGTAVSAPPAAPAIAAPTPASPPPARTYTIRSGDTLSGIAQRFTGNANRWGELYNANAGVIDSTAHARGKAGGGHWIFPGTVLTLPW